jgi:hypothetical protein
MEKSTKIILAVAGVGALGYLTYKMSAAKMASEDSAVSHSALASLTSEELDKKVKELVATQAQAELAQKQAVAAGDKELAAAATAVAANAKEGVAVVQKAVNLSRKKTLEYGEPAIKNYQNLINGVLAGLNKLTEDTSSTGLSTLDDDGRWGPKTQGASDGFVLFIDNLSNTVTDNLYYKGLYAEGKLPLIAALVAAVGRVPADAEKSLVKNAGSALLVKGTQSDGSVMVSAIRDGGKPYG